MRHQDAPAGNVEASAFAAPLATMLTTRVTEYALGLLTSTGDEKG